MSPLSLRRSGLLAATLALSACVAPAYVSPVEVTRFTGAAPATLGSGAITLAAAPGTDAASPEYAAFAAAVRQELERIGYRVGASDGQQALLSLSQTLAQPEDRRGPVSVGGGASTGSYGSGVGVGVGIDLTPRPAERLATRLSVAIRDTTGGANLWEGRAQMVASGNSDYASAQAAAARLAAALFAQFPGADGETVIVE